MAKDEVEFAEIFESIFQIDLSDFDWKTKAFGCCGDTYRVDDSGTLNSRKIKSVSPPPVFMNNHAADPEAMTHTQRGDWKQISYSGTISMTAYDGSDKVEVSARFEDGNLKELSLGRLL